MRVASYGWPPGLVTIRTTIRRHIMQPSYDTSKLRAYEFMVWVNTGTYTRAQRETVYAYDMAQAVTLIQETEGLIRFRFAKRRS